MLYYKVHNWKRNSIRRIVKRIVCLIFTLFAALYQNYYEHMSACFIVIFISCNQTRYKQKHYMIWH